MNPTLLRSLNILFALFLVVGLQSCKQEEKKAASSNAAGMDGSASVNAAAKTIHETKKDDSKGNKDKKDQPAEAKEMLVDLLQLEKVWPTLDSSKNKIRVEGYVTRVWPIAGKQCSVDVSYYPYATDWNMPFNQKMLTISFSFTDSYQTKEECDGLIKHKISVLIDPIKKDDKDLVNLAASAIQAPDTDEDAADEFKQFYPNLTSGQYPELKVLKLEQFTKEALKKETPRLLQAQVVKSESNDTGCKLSLSEGDAGISVTSNYKDQAKNHSAVAITKDNCASIKGKFVVLNGYLNENKKDIEADSYFVTEAK